jgi:hypothetical protein
MRSHLPKCPPPQSGVHIWLMRAAHWCKRAGMDPERTIALLHENISRRPTPPDEIETTVGKVFAQKKVSERAPWPSPDRARIKALCRSGWSVDVIANESPDRIDDFCTAECLELFFAEDALLCLGRVLQSPSVRTRSEWQTVDELWLWQFVVPSPMIGKAALTSGPEPHMSARALANVGPRKWLVVEADFSAADAKSFGCKTSEDVCACVIAELAKSRPLVAVVHSGSKSLHGWFATDPAESESELLRFMRLAVTYGADPKTWTCNQFVRTPGALRDGCVIQRVIYLDRGRARKWA